MIKGNHHGAPCRQILSMAVLGEVIISGINAITVFFSQGGKES